MKTSAYLLTVAILLVKLNLLHAGEGYGQTDGKPHEFLVDTGGRSHVRFAISFSKTSAQINCTIRVYDADGKRIDIGSEKLTGDRVIHIERKERKPDKFRVVIDGSGREGSSDSGAWYNVFSAFPVEVVVPPLPGQAKPDPAKPDPEAQVMQAIAAIRKLGGQVLVDPHAPGKPVVAISWGSAAGVKLGDSDVALFKLFPKLQKLDLAGTTMRNDYLVHLAGLTELQELNLSLNAWVSDEGLKHLKGLTNLRLLRLYGANVGPEGIRGLKKALPRLRIEGP